jgi:hypothetical protein
MAQQKKDNKKNKDAEDYLITEFDSEDFKKEEAEKFNTKFPALEIPPEIEDDIDNDYDIKDDSEEDE